MRNRVRAAWAAFWGLQEPEVIRDGFGKPHQVLSFGKHGLRVQQAIYSTCYFGGDYVGFKEEELNWAQAMERFPDYADLLKARAEVGE
jgi:hypothetical protein